MRRKDQPSATRKAVFLTRRVLVDDAGSFLSETSLQLSVAARSGVPLLYAAGYRIVVLSNETGIAYGCYTERSLSDNVDRIGRLMASAGAPTAGYYYCPHHPGGTETLYAFDCDCRMPQAGLVLQAAAELRVDLASSWVIGDLLDEVEAAHIAGARGVLVDNGNELEWRTEEPRRPDRIADDVAEAALIIASSTRGGIRA